MDEILASIRKIISEDDTPGHEPKAAADEEPLLLTRRVDAPPAGAEAAPHVDHAPDDEWVGEAAATDAASSFDKLSDVADTKAGERAALVMPPPGRSLEDVTRELLRPMLKDWLDQHLATIVQARVDEEVERIARRRVR